jgi:cyanate lyase
MTAREQLTEKILASKRKQGLKWSAIASALGASSPIVYTAALLGQFPLTVAEAEKAAALFDLDSSDTALLTEPPNRGTGTVMPPTDPLIYRFYELVQNYGSTWKALIEEEFGDGIMSAIDFEMSIARQPDPKGDRVKIEMSGKFLPYKRY